MSKEFLSLLANAHSIMSMGKVRPFIVTDKASGVTITINSIEEALKISQIVNEDFNYLRDVA